MKVKQTPITVIFFLPSWLHMISARQMMKGIYSNVLIWIEEAFWDYLFLCTIYILACMCESWEGPLSWKACHRKLWAGDMLNTHLDMLSGRMLARTHTCTQGGFCRPLRAAQCRHLLFTLPPRVHCRRGHHSERTRRDWREWNHFSEMFPFAAPFTLGTARARSRTVRTFCINYTWP